jgi:mannose-6-phosphate isomerase-like protein (cupin superfamily)
MVHPTLKYLILILFCYGLNQKQGLAQQKNINDYFSNEVAKIKVQPLFSDSLVSSFLIEIPVKDTVNLHKHLKHSEHVFILEGSAKMILKTDTLSIEPNQLIFIPKNTPHKVWVTSKSPLRVVSIQAPQFNGNDRILLE